jgi:hypothetical protein
MSTTLPTSSEKDAKIFINYRREDASGYAGRLYEWLSERFGPDSVFMDISAIKPGVDFVTAIETEVAACEAVLVVIGRQWLNCSADGQRRLDDPNDLVRLEIASALTRNALVIPVLVEGATMPRERDLPPDLRQLARRNALEISDGRWEFDAGRLIDILAERLEKRSGQKAKRRTDGGSTRRVGLGRYWALFPVRLLAGLLVLAGAFLPQVYMAFRPEPVKLEDTRRFSPASLNLDSEELTIEAPQTNSDEGLMLSHNGKAEEAVDVGFERAQLDKETLIQLSELNPPTGTSRLDFRTAKPPNHAEGEPCRTFLNILAEERKMPSALHLYQFGARGAGNFRGLDLKATGGRLLVSILTTPPEDEHENAPGCEKDLKVGSDFTRPKGYIDSIAVVAEDDSVIHFSFTPLSPKNSLWDGPEGLFQPFDLGIEKSSPDAPPPFRARAVEIKTHGGNTSEPSPVLSAHSPEGGELLNIQGLNVGSGRMQINVSGVGFVKVNGTDYVNLLARIKAHKLSTTLLLLTDAALLIWFVSLLLNRRQTSMR